MADEGCFIPKEFFSEHFMLRLPRGGKKSSIYRILLVILAVQNRVPGNQSRKDFTVDTIADCAEMEDYSYKDVKKGVKWLKKYGYIRKIPASGTYTLTGHIKCSSQ